MPNFMIAYHGGVFPESKEEGKAHMAKWKSWIASLGEKIVNPGTPLPISKILTADSVREDKDSKSMNGFAVIKADNMDEAVSIAKLDPFLAIGGTIRISHMMEMK